MRLSRYILLVVVCFAIATTLYLQSQPRDGIWRFNFTPDSAADVESFITISGESDYSNWTGYGWLDAEGPLETGRWPGDEHDTWESRRNLNVITRRGPDDLARSHATGPATFALDLEPGHYEVWLLSGDAGYLEYIPREPYSLVVEGKTACTFGINAADFITQFETPAREDELTHTDIWRLAVEPRFRWCRVIVDVIDGQLTVNVASERRDRTILALMGDYAHTEMRSGPADRFSGALNALIVLPATTEMTTGEQLVNQIDAWRQQNIIEKWPRLEVDPGATVSMSAADHARGYTVSPVDVLSPVMPYDRHAHSEAVIKLRATPGEYVPVSFAVTPLRDLGKTRVELTALQNRSATAAQPILTAGNLEIGVLRYVATLRGKEGGAWQPQAAMIVPGNHWDIREGVSKQFWLTYRVPEGMPAGKYTGSIEIIPERAASSYLDLQLEVLPFRLQRPVQLAIGMTYFSPVQYAASGEADFWKRLQAEFSDMRAHNMTTVQYTGIHMDDYDRMQHVFTLFREAGFEQPLNLLESHGTMERWRRKGVPWSSSEFQTEYVQLLRDFLQQAQQREWPPVIIGFGDEFTNRALEEVGAEIAKRLQEIPGIVTAADVNGYKEMTLLAPEVNVIAFNEGWDGPEKVNRGKRLLNKETVDYILNAGATPWLVNVGMDRFSNGYWFWKMVRLGVRGKMEWMYRGYNGMPFNNFDADPMRAHAVYPGPDGTAIPSLNYEWMRIGLDDLAYLNTLEQLLEVSRGEPQKESAVTAAESFIRQLDDMIEDDMSYYRDPGDRKQNLWPTDRYKALRTETVALILCLMYSSPGCA